ncbi:MAG: carboxypeptidase-like regulatory domain-containing protein [Gemmatimonadota bacterium]|nr:carboxypeptidase-like regulatory domain-containing protein [Gemmatimonadota bacterium]
MRSTSARPFAFVLLWMTFVGGTASRAVSPSGTVLDALTGTPVPGAVVSLRPSGARVVTDEEGRFSFIDLPGAEVRSLRVTHPDFQPSEIPLGSQVDIPWRLEIVLRPRVDFAPQTDEQREVRSRAEAAATQTGGTLWREEEFAFALTRVAYVLDLLAYSGLVEDLDRSTDEERCVRIRRNSDCARVEVVGDTNGPRAIQDYFPAEIDSFLIVPPELTRRGSRYESEHGVVILFIRSLDL